MPKSKQNFLLDSKIHDGFINYCSRSDVDEGNHNTFKEKVLREKYEELKSKGLIK